MISRYGIDKIAEWRSAVAIWHTLLPSSSISTALTDSFIKFPNGGCSLQTGITTESFNISSLIFCSGGHDQLAVLDLFNADQLIGDLLDVSDNTADNQDLQAIVSVQV